MHIPYHTIQGLPIRCPTAALQSLIGSCSISSYISQRQLAFINSIVNMEASDLPKQLLEARVRNPRATVTRGNLLDELCLPSIKQLLSTPYNKETWKRSIKRLLNIRAYISMQDQCEKYPLGDCALLIGRPAQHWTVTLHARHPCNPQEQLSDPPSSRVRRARSECQSFPMEERSQST